jgi:hypothetical protein
LLSEKGDALANILPSYKDYEGVFDDRMAELGFGRSPSQMNTARDGTVAFTVFLIS